MFSQNRLKDRDVARLTVLAPAYDPSALHLKRPVVSGVSARVLFRECDHLFLRLRGDILHPERPSEKATPELAHRLEISEDSATIYSQNSQRPGWSIIDGLPQSFYLRRCEAVMAALELATFLFSRFAALQLFVMLRYAHSGSDRPRIEVIEKALTILETELQDGCSMQALAERIGMSPSEFSRTFRNCLGCTPHAYLDLVRMGEAHRYLLHSDQSLADTAYALGYSSQAHFTTAFGRQTGTTPGAYREKMRTRLHA